MVFQGSLTGVSMNHQGCFMQDSWIGSFKCFKKVSGVSKWCFEGALREFQGYFIEILILRMIEGSIRAV